MEYLATLKELTRDLFWWYQPNYTEKDYPDLTGKVYVVTGASSGIGLECARQLLMKGARVYITGRTPSKIEKALADLGQFGEVELLPIHNEDLNTIAPAVAQFKESRLDGIIHNAGITYNGHHIIEPLGIESIIVINVLAAQLLQEQLLPLLQKTEGSRTVWVSSCMHNASPYPGGIAEDYNSVEYGAAYGQTKAMNIYQAIQFGKRYPRIVSVAAHPGNISSDIRKASTLRNYIVEKLSRDVVFGMYAVLEPLLNPEVTTADNGSYYIPFGTKARIRPDVLAAANGENGEKFWKWATEITRAYQT